MTVDLLIAPPASGKTETCIQKIKATRASQPLAKVWVLVPERLQAGAFRRRLAASGGALGVQVGRFPDLLKNILEQAEIFPPLVSDPLKYRIIQDTVDMATAAGNLPYFSPLRTFPGFILSLMDAFAELKRAMITPAQFSEFERFGPAAERELAELYILYQNRLEELGWIDQEDIYLLAARILKETPHLVNKGQLVVVDGFDSFNQSQVQVLQCLAELGVDILITLPGQPDSNRPAHRRFAVGIEKLTQALSPTILHLDNPPHLPLEVSHIERNIFEPLEVTIQPATEPILLEARNPAEEAREALRWIKKLVVRQNIPLSGCAVFTPNAAIYNPLIRASAEEFGIPVRFTLDEPLDQSPAITSLVNLLSLPIHNYSSRHLLHVLRSPYFKFSGNTEIVDTFEMISRVGQVVEGKTQWDEVWERLEASTEKEHYDLDDERNAPQLPRGNDARQLRVLMQSIFDLITPPAEERTMTDWITWLEDLLDHLDFFIRADSERDRSACKTFWEMLRALVLSETVAGRQQVAYPRFFANLQAALQGESYREESVFGQPSLLVGRMTDARGIRFDAVAILGLSEGSFPVNEQPDPFLDESLREKLGLELRLQREQAGLFYQAVTRTDQYLLLTRPYLSEDGEAWEESAYWKAVTKLFDETAHIKINPDTSRPLTDAASSSELLFSAVHRKSLPRKYEFLSDRWQQLQHAHVVLQARRAKKLAGEHEGFVAPVSKAINRKFSPDSVWSPSRLETYGNCPFQFFIRHCLDLDTRKEPEFGLDARQLGSMLHKILEETYRSVSDGRDLQSLLAALEKVCKAGFTSAPTEFGFRPSVLWEVEKSQLKEKLERTLTALSLSTDWNPYGFEQKFGIREYPPLKIQIGDETIKIRGVVDRVDKNAQGKVRVIDYKTGSRHLDKKSLQNGYSLQLPIYALAARDALDLGIPEDGMYWMILAAEAGSLKLASFSFEELKGVEAAVAILKEHLLRILYGIRSAEFPPRSPIDGCPTYCPAAQWCWRYEPGW